MNMQSCPRVISVTNVGEKKSGSITQLQLRFFSQYEGSGEIMVSPVAIPRLRKPPRTRLIVAEGIDTRI